MKRVILILVILLISICGKSQITYYMDNTGNASVATAEGLRTLFIVYQEVVIPTLTSGNSLDLFWSTVANEPGYSRFTSGTINVHIGVASSVSNAVQVAARVYRVNSSGVVQESSPLSSFQYAPTSMTVLTFNIIKSWATGSDTDRFVTEIVAYNSSGGSVSYVYRVGGAYGYVETPFTETQRRIFIVD